MNRDTWAAAGPTAPPRVIFLGTGGAINLERFQSAIVVEVAGLRLLLDTGGGLDLVRRLTGIQPGSTPADGLLTIFAAPARRFSDSTVLSTAVRARASG